MIAILKALDEVHRLEAHPPETPVVVLGGEGHVGAALVARLKTSSARVFSIDTDNRALMDEVGVSRCLRPEGRR